MDIKININEYIGFKIRQFRISKGLTGSDLAKLVHVSQQQISRYERGCNTISISLLILISDRLNISLVSFLPREILFLDDEISLDKYINKNECMLYNK